MSPLNNFFEKAKRNIPNSLIIKIDLLSNCQGYIYSDEEKFISNFSVGRKKEFIAGRTLARQSLQELGKEPCSILNDKNGCPLWPDSVVGSISHKRNICATLIGLKENFDSVGIDIEFNEPLSQSMWNMFTTIEEISEGNTTDFSDQIFANMLLSAKEAVYKSIFPIAQVKTPSLKDLSLNFKKNDDFFNIKTGFEKNAWEGKQFLESSHILSIIWLSGKNV